MQFSSFASGSVTLAWNPSVDANVVGYNVYFGGASRVYTNKITVTGTTNAIVPGLVQGATYYFAVTAYDKTGLESPFSNEASSVVPLNSASQPPTFNSISSISITENAGEQTLVLTGINPGFIAANKKPKIKITAASSNRAIISSAKGKYKSPETTGTLTFKPQKNAIGTTTITVSINNGGKSNNIVTQTFNVTVLAASSPNLATGNLNLVASNSNLGAANTSLSMPPPPSAALTVTDHAPGQFALNVSGVDGTKYIVQASENLVDWIPVYTNTSPFTYTDTQADQFKQRFYHAIPAP